MGHLLHGQHRRNHQHALYLAHDVTQCIIRLICINSSSHCTDRTSLTSTGWTFKATAEIKSTRDQTSATFRNICNADIFKRIFMFNRKSKRPSRRYVDCWSKGRVIVSRKEDLVQSVLIEFRRIITWMTVPDVLREVIFACKLFIVAH